VASRADAETVVRALGCQSELIEITPIVDGYFDASTDSEPPSSGRRGNFAARARMAVLYDRSVTWQALVCGTGNKTEALLGYTTIFGDNAAALMPIGDLYKSQVRQLAAEIGVPDEILRKPPTADLWPDQTDEGELGMTYAHIDRLLYWMIDRRRSDAQLVALGFKPADIARVARLVAASEYKRQTPPVAKLTTRTPGVDYLYPRRRPGSRIG
jgi:NAD+ synthase